jgi:hypothetical protein
LPGRATFSRVFARSGGVVFGGIDDYFGTRAVTFVTLFDDGTYMESTDLNPPSPEYRAEPPMMALYCSNMPVEHIYDRHLAAVAHYEKLTGAHALRFAPDEWRKVWDYGHHINGQQLFGRKEPLAVPQPANQQVLVRS